RPAQAMTWCGPEQSSVYVGWPGGYERPAAGHAVEVVTLLPVVVRRPAPPVRFDRCRDDVAEPIGRRERRQLVAEVAPPVHAERIRTQPFGDAAQRLADVEIRDLLTERPRIRHGVAVHVLLEVVIAAIPEHAVEARVLVDEAEAI